MRNLQILTATAAILAIGAGSTASAAQQSAIFAGGCFWTMEHGLETIPGVTSAVSGYTGGPQQHPTYEQVSSDQTGDVEAVKVTFDPAKISYRALVDHYWRLMDPTDAGGQACDRGPSYHSAIFVDSPEQRNAAMQSKAAIADGPLKGRPVVTPIRNAMTFWPAEAYHQHYAQKNPLAYGAYRIGCGRDRVLKALWGPQTHK